MDSAALSIANFYGGDTLESSCSDGTLPLIFEMAASVKQAQNTCEVSR